MRIGIVGCGKMGTAWMHGVMRSGVIAADSISGVDPSPAARQEFTQVTGICASDDLATLAECGVVLLCTKPQELTTVLGKISAQRGDRPLLVLSIAAGITVAALEAAAGPAVRVIRAMPNTPALVGKGAAGYCLGARATRADAELAQSLLESVGIAIEVPERLMDAITGLSGSGPAYAYLMIEAMAEGAVAMGLPRPEAIGLAAQTLLGAATMVLQTGDHPAVLKDRVTSPGGTTLAGLAELEQRGVRSALAAAVVAAARRSAELGR